nr:unnamed protein product [Callosobruchus analis]
MVLLLKWMPHMTSSLPLSTDTVTTQLMPWLYVVLIYSSFTYMQIGLGVQLMHVYYATVACFAEWKKAGDHILVDSCLGTQYTHLSPG